MTNLCRSCHQIPAVPGISFCWGCAEDASAEIAHMNQPRYTGEPCVWCGAALTDSDDASSSPNVCAKCRREADQREAEAVQQKTKDLATEDGDWNRLWLAAELNK